MGLCSTLKARWAQSAVRRAARMRTVYPTNPKIGWPSYVFLLKHRQISRRQILNQAGKFLGNFLCPTAQSPRRGARWCGSLGGWPRRQIAGAANRCGKPLLMVMRIYHALFAFGVELPPPPPRFLPSSRESLCALLHAMTLDRGIERARAMTDVKGCSRNFQPSLKSRSTLQMASTRVQELSIRYMRPLGTSLVHMCSYGTHV